MKGPEGEVEAKSVSRAAAVLGAELSEIRRLQMELDGELMERRLIVFDKTAPTPAKYPRNTAKIKKEPLK